MRRLVISSLALGLFLISNCTPATPASPATSSTPPTPTPMLRTATPLSPTATPVPPAETQMQPSDQPALAADKLAEIGIFDRFLVAYTVPGMDRVTLTNTEYKDGLTMDIYHPAGFDFSRTLPVVVFVNGFVDEEDDKLKDLSQYVSWGQLTAASEMIGVAYESEDPTVNVHDVINYVRENGPSLGADGDRICLWSCSANQATALYALTDMSAGYRDSLACGVLYYGDSEFDGITYAEQGLSADIPLFIVKAGTDDFSLNKRIDEFVEKARAADIPLEYVEYEKGIHAFDIYQDTDESREIIKKTVEFMQKHLEE